LRRITLILVVSLIALTVSASLAICSFMNILSSVSNVKVKHSSIKIDNSTAAIIFVLSSPKEGKYYYTIYCNCTDQPFSYSSDGGMRAGGSFTYTLYVKLKPDKTLAINIKIWWEGNLIDGMTHYVRAGGI